MTALAPMKRGGCRACSDPHMDGNSLNGSTPFYTHWTINRHSIRKLDHTGHLPTSTWVQTLGPQIPKWGQMAQLLLCGPLFLTYTPRFTYKGISMPAPKQLSLPWARPKRRNVSFSEYLIHGMENVNPLQLPGLEAVRYMAVVPAYWLLRSIIWNKDLFPFCKQYSVTWAEGFAGARPTNTYFRSLLQHQRGEGRVWACVVTHISITWYGRSV